jgi:hypothetical protein
MSNYPNDFEKLYKKARAEAKKNNPTLEGIDFDKQVYCEVSEMAHTKFYGEEQGEPTNVWHLEQNELEQHGFKKSLKEMCYDQYSMLENCS